MSKIPKKLSAGNKLDAEIARADIISELDATNLYEEQEEMATSPSLKATLHSIAKEEKTHTGEFLAELAKSDPEQAEEIKNGMSEEQERG